MTNVSLMFSAFAYVASPSGLDGAGLAGARLIFRKPSAPLTPPEPFPAPEPLPHPPPPPDGPENPDVPLLGPDPIEPSQI